MISNFSCSAFVFPTKKIKFNKIRSIIIIIIKNYADLPEAGRETCEGEDGDSSAPDGDAERGIRPVGIFPMSFTIMDIAR